jgi:hypothetical protein
VTILVLWNKSEKFESITIFNTLAKSAASKNTSNNIVDELLLSANELNIYGKSSLIGYHDKENLAEADLLIQQIKTDPDKAYQSILKRKLEKLKLKQTPKSDFYIRPVPK